jgi:hypothetical protein
MSVLVEIVLISNNYNINFYEKIVFNMAISPLANMPIGEETDRLQVAFNTRKNKETVSAGNRFL